MPRPTPPRLLMLCPGASGQQATPLAAVLTLWQAVRPFCPAALLVAGGAGGELAAHCVAGALAASDALRLAQLRTELMHECLHTHPGQVMLAVNGLAPDQAAAVLAGDLFAVAIEHGARDVVAGGPLAGLAAVSAAITAAGGRSRRWPGHVAAHTSYMAPAVARFGAALRLTPFGPYRIPVLSGLDGSLITSKATAIEHLSRQLAEPVRWSTCMDAGAAAGVRAALELRPGPGATLVPLLRARHPAIDSRGAADFAGMDALLAWLAGVATP